MKRGEVWTAAGGKDYAGKPRPVVIVQDDAFSDLESVIVCAITTTPTDAPLFRLPIEPSTENGLRAHCRLMADRVTALPKSKLGYRIGKLAADDLRRLDQSLLVMLGLAGSHIETEQMSVED